MIEIIIISLAITALVILDDLIFDATLKMTHPLTSAKLHATAYDDMDFEDYCNYRINNKGE